MKGTTMVKFLHFNVEEQTRNLPTKLRKKFQSRTVAVVPIPGDILASLAASYIANKAEVVIPIKVGVTFLSLKDRYTKSVGRDESMAKSKIVMIKVKGVTISDTHVFVHLETFQGVSMNLRLNKVSGFTTVTGSLAA